MAGLATLFDAWGRFLAATPWTSNSSNDLFRVEDAASGAFYYASIMGGGGGDIGLLLARGAAGLRVLGGVIEEELDRDQAATECGMLTISVHDGPFPPWYEEFLPASRGAKRGPEGRPLIFAKDAGRASRAPEEGEVRILAASLGAIVDLCRQGALRPPFFEPGQAMPSIVLEEGGTYDLREVAPALERVEVPAVEFPDERAAALRSLPRLDKTYLVSCRTAPATVQGRAIRMLLVYDPEEDLVLGGGASYLEDLDAIARDLLAVFEGEGAVKQRGLPREIRTDSRFFYEAFKDALAGLGIRILCLEEIPALEAIRESFASFLDEAPGPEGHPRR